MILLLLQAGAQKVVQVVSVPVSNKPLNPTIETAEAAVPPNTHVIPFNRVGNLMIIQATADTTKGNFILDTGAPGLVLNLTYFRQYPHTEAEDRGSVSGAVTGAVQTTVRKFSFGSIECKNLNADMISLGHIEDRKGVKILGLIGVSFFKDCEVIIDYEQSLIHLHRITKKESSTYKSHLLDSSNFNVLDFDVIDNKIIAYIKLGERKMKFFVDTGAESNILDSRLPNKVFESMTITGRTKVVGAGNKPVEALYGNLKNMKVGSQERVSLPFVITNLESACISEVCCIDGILGFDFLAGHKVGFNFCEKANVSMEIRKHILMVVMRSWLALLTVHVCVSSFAQSSAGKSEFRNNECIIEINKKVNNDLLDQFIAKYDLKELDLKNVFKTNRLDSLKNLGWKVKINNDQQLVISKSLTGSSNINNPADNIVFTDKELSIAERFPSTSNGLLYGYDRFKNKYPFAVRDSLVTFYLRNHLTAGKVVLAGSFNNFSPDGLRMKKTDSGWIATVKLTPGKYWYKFVADGNWMTDDDNYLRENDGLGNTNSVYFKPNFVFDLAGHHTATKAFVTGSFNNWKKGELAMTKAADGWVLPLYLANGTHTYKYIVDNVSFTDTDKFEKLPDGNGSYNSVVRFGTNYTFRLNGFANARQIILSGSFNGWRKDELYLKKTGTGWELPYTLGAGNYQYKFIVDGNWILDPANPLTAAMNGQTNSYLTIGANYTFRFKGAPNAKSVFVAGDFNNWAPGTHEMKKKGDEWTGSVYLSAGKHKYKYIVDGKWITDPTNKNWEQNEFGTGNSVVWVEK